MSKLVGTIKDNIQNKDIRSISIYQGKTGHHLTVVSYGVSEGEQKTTTKGDIIREVGLHMTDIMKKLGEPNSMYSTRCTQRMDTQMQDGTQVVTTELSMMRLEV